MSTIREQVRQFHLAFEQPTLSVPQIPPEERVRLRLRLIAEKFVELLDASLGRPSPVRDYDAWEAWNTLTSDSLIDYINKAPLAVELPEFADALADLDYVVEGTRQEFGITGAPIAAAVHGANMAKLGPDGRPIRRDDGKIVKPAGWASPDIAAELRKQGWEG